LRDLIRSIYGGETSLGKMEGQTLLPKEIIISDDASTDDTTKIAMELSEEYPDIRYRRNAVNSGTSITCNEAIRIASSTFITRMDADDMREPWSFQEMFKLQLLHPHSMIYDDVMIFVNGKLKGKPWKMPEYYFWDLLKFNTIHAGIMFPRQAWIDCGGYPEEFRNGRDDWAINIALGAAGYCGVHLPRPGYLYRREQQNRSIRNGNQQDKFAAQIRNHFEGIYSGRLTMPGCCGGRNRNGGDKSPQSLSAEQKMIGAEGMTLVSYQGENMGTTAFFGPTTGAAYRFSARDRVKNVDNRDLHHSKGRGLLDVYEYGKSVFQIYAPPEPVVPPEQQIQEALQKIEEENLSAAAPAEEPVVSGSGTPIYAGVIKGIGATSVVKLLAAGITTWEQFYHSPNEQIFSILGVSISRIEEMKRELTSGA